MIFSTKIEKLIQAKKEAFSRPVVAFIIFESQEGQERCFEYFMTSKNMIGQIEYNESGKAFTILGKKMELEEVSEPSDLIWENQGVHPRKIRRYKIIVYVAMLCFLVILLYILIIIKINIRSNSRWVFANQNNWCKPLTEVKDLPQQKNITQKVYESKLYHMSNYGCYCE